MSGTTLLGSPRPVHPVAASVATLHLQLQHPRPGPTTARPCDQSAQLRWIPQHDRVVPTCSLRDTAQRCWSAPRDHDMPQSLWLAVSLWNTTTRTSSRPPTAHGASELCAVATLGPLLYQYPIWTRRAAVPQTTHKHHTTSGVSLLVADRAVPVIIMFGSTIPNFRYAVGLPSPPLRTCCTVAMRPAPSPSVRPCGHYIHKLGQVRLDAFPPLREPVDEPLALTV